MSDLIRCLQEVKSLAADPSVPAPQRLAAVARSFEALDLTGFADESREPWEADLAHLQDALAQSGLAAEERAPTDEQEFQRMLDLVEDVASQAIDGKLARIVEELDAGAHRLPEDAIREVRQHADLMVPRLIQVLQEATAEGREGMAREGNAHFFALFLLTELRAEEAFPAILEAFSLPGELPRELFGDAVTDILPCVLAQFAAERLEVLDALIDDRALNAYVRWSRCRVTFTWFATAVSTGTKLSSVFVAICARPSRRRTKSLPARSSASWYPMRPWRRSMTSGKLLVTT